MATAERRRLTWWAGPALLVAVAGGAALVRSGSSGVDTAEPAAVVVEAASAYQFTDLAELVQASDAIVRGHVIGTERGRLVASDGSEPDTGVVSRLVTLQVDAVLAGEVGPRLLVEEEGWLTDGRLLAVDGAPPSEPGQEVIWFLQRLPDAEVPAYLVVSSQGRFLVTDGALQGGDRHDPLVRDIERSSPRELAADVVAMAT